MKQKPNNGIKNVDTPQMEEMRAQVVEQELSVRSWKAYYEKMYYSLEAEKLEPEYAKYKERLNERLKKEKEEYEKFMQTLKNSVQTINEENKLGEVKIEESDTIPDGISDKAPVIQMN